MGFILNPGTPVLLNVQGHLPECFTPSAAFFLEFFICAHVISRSLLLQLPFFSLTSQCTPGECRQKTLYCVFGFLSPALVNTFLSPFQFALNSHPYLCSSVSDHLCAGNFDLLTNFSVTKFTNTPFVKLHTRY